MSAVTARDALPNLNRPVDAGTGEVRFIAYVLCAFGRGVCCPRTKSALPTLLERTISHETAMAQLNSGYSHLLVSSVRSCAKCGKHFGTFGREYICPRCRKTKGTARKAEEGCELTSREKQIVGLICRAKTNKEIAYELCLTEGTVKEYLYQIFRKLHVTNRTELALSQLAPSFARAVPQELKKVV